VIESLEYKGCNFAWRIEGAGPPLVVIEGVGAFGKSPSPLTEILKNHFTILSFDNRGIGASEPAAVPLSIEQMADDTLALMNHLGWHSAHIVGHSMGGLIAQQLALTAKPRVRTLSLLCTFARGADATRMSARVFWIGLRLRLAPRRIRRKAFMELVVPPGGEPRNADELAAMLSGVFGHDIADLPPVSNRQLDAMKRCDVTPRLHELAGIPTLVISAEHDLIARPASGRSIAAGIPGAKYTEIPGASHAFPVMEPERCAEMILEHTTGEHISSA